MPTSLPRILRHLSALVAGLAVLSVLMCGTASAQQATTPVDAAVIRDTVESVAAVVDREYFDVGVANQVATSLRERLADGRYSRADTLESLAGALTRDLFDLTHDKHLAVTVRRNATTTPTSTAPADDDREVRGRRMNFGVRRVEVLAGNVGYFDLTSFYRPDEARDAIAGAMRTVRNADALILDVRDNTGGSPETVALLASYLFDTPKLHLFDIVPRSGDGAQGYATAEPAVPDHNEARPVYVLTAARTFSAGEGFAFLLQEMHRAEVVGEVTAGAANPGRAYPATDRVDVTVPNGQVRMALNGGNWEGRGVIPDVKTSASEALRVAHMRALQALIKRTPSGAWQDTLVRELATLQRP